MDSFVLSETLKYLYLLFAKPEELYLGKIILNVTLPRIIGQCCVTCVDPDPQCFGRLYLDFDLHWE
jgi:hypothetical protein